MRNIKLTLEYDGTNYNGWQKQPNLPTIQGTVEEALTQLTKTSINIIGAGRTDTGVHAEGQVANFHTDVSIPVVAFQKGLNAILPHDIVVTAAEVVPAEFHARFSATSRRYRYTLLNRNFPSALLRYTSYFYSTYIEVNLVKAICDSLVGEWDFSSFQKTGSDRQNPFCEIFEACCWITDEFVYIEIEADSFLRGMVRAIVGTILKCIRLAPGNTETVCAKFHEILSGKDRSLAGPSAPAHGLSLIRVNYDDK